MLQHGISRLQQDKPQMVLTSFSGRKSLGTNYSLNAPAKHSGNYPLSYSRPGFPSSKTTAQLQGTQGDFRYMCFPLNSRLSCHDRHVRNIPFTQLAMWHERITAPKMQPKLIWLHGTSCSRDPGESISLAGVRVKGLRFASQNFKKATTLNHGNLPLKVVFSERERHNCKLK